MPLSKQAVTLSVVNERSNLKLKELKSSNQIIKHDKTDPFQDRLSFLMDCGDIDKSATSLRIAVETPPLRMPVF